MEQQFILRLPDKLKNVDPKDCKLNRTGQKEVVFYHKDKDYKGIICRMPTIVESQKEINGKIYKIADISTLVVIYDTDFNVEDEVRKAELSGLTPPTKFIKERRFSKVSVVRSDEIEKIEKKVAELLKEDVNAMKVEILSNDKDSSDADLDMIAAEIESNVTKKIEISALEPNKNINKTDESIRISETNESGKLEKKLSTDALIEPDVLKNEGKINNFNNEGFINVSTGLEENITKELLINQENVTNPELQDLINKIKEKEVLLSKAANPILKKRFEQNLSELKTQFEKRKAELGL